MAMQVHTSPVSETTQALGVSHTQPFLSQAPPRYYTVLNRLSLSHQLPLFAICDFLLEELPFLRMNADLIAFKEAEAQFSFLFGWMDRLKGFQPIFRLQAEKLAEKRAEVMARMDDGHRG